MTFDICVELAKMMANIEQMFNSSRGEVQGQIQEQDRQIDSIHSDVQVLQKSIENIMETLKADQVIKGLWQHTRPVKHKPDYTSADPRRPLMKHAQLLQGYCTIEWFNFNNLHVDNPYATWASEGSLAMAKKIKASNVPFFGVALIDDWVDDFEDWCKIQFGSPYASRMDEQVIRLFLSAIESCKDIKAAY
ncbi:hypothetical protein BG006_001651 [Podila minutissima]|uniref:Uncharacterized protein n=1 Tax=Podila minutissima TaxID=64525 RepID=A0A9P5SC98_9FUNG|nr:hypothetical protein BG006_001651 [Podila minutissima]